MSAGQLTARMPVWPVLILPEGGGWGAGMSSRLVVASAQGVIPRQLQFLILDNVHNINSILFYSRVTLSLLLSFTNWTYLKCFYQLIDCSSLFKCLSILKIFCFIYLFIYLSYLYQFIILILIYLILIIGWGC